MIDGVGIYCIKDGKVLVGCRDDGSLGGPGGHIEKGESPEQAAKRETQEEFGIVPKDLMYVCRGAKQKNGFEPYLYICTDWDGEIKTDNKEMFCPAFRTVEEIGKNEKLFPPFEYGLKAILCAIRGKDGKGVYLESDRH